MDADRTCGNHLDDRPAGAGGGAIVTSEERYELVSLDTTAKTMTVKSRVAYQEAISELKHDGRPFSVRQRAKRTVGASI